MVYIYGMVLHRNKYYILILYEKSRVVSLLRVSAVRDQRVPRVGNCLFLRARAWGIDHQEKKKWQIPGVMPGGGMVTGGIEPYIMLFKNKARIVV